MISIKATLSELDRLGQLQTRTLSAYQSLLRAIQQYAVEVDAKFLEEHRTNLDAIAVRLNAAAGVEVVTDSSSAVRCELRRYRDICGAYLKHLREEFEQNARALEGLMAAMAASDAEGEGRLTGELAKLGTLADSIEIGWIRSAVRTAAGNLRRCVEEIRKDHQAQVLQLAAEIQTLHQQIQQLEAGSTAAPDTIRVHSRSEIESKVEGFITDSQAFSVIALRIRNLPLLKAQYAGGLVEELLLAFNKRLKNRVGDAALVGQWAEQQLIVLLPVSKMDAITKAKELAGALAGDYVFPAPGTVRRINMQVECAVADCGAGDGMNKMMAKLDSLWGVAAQA